MVKIVRSNCLSCQNIGKVVEFGSCGCSEVEKYDLETVAPLVGDIEDAMTNLCTESEKLKLWAQKLDKDAEVRKASLKRCRKIKLEITQFGDETKALLKEMQERNLKKADDMVVLGVLDGSLKSGNIKGWIEKKMSVG